MTAGAGRGGLTGWLERAAGVAVLVMLWELVGRYGVFGPTWPPLSAVGGYALEPAHAAVLGRGVAATASAALAGFLLGSVTGLGLACIAVLWLRLQRGMGRLAALVNAVPLIAVGPVMIVTVGRETTPVAIAALAAFFSVFVAASAGLATSRREQQDLLVVLGANRLRTLWLMQLPAALPAIVDGLRLAVSAAVVGAILGEWFGAPVGLGLLLVSAMQNFQIQLLWAAALLGVLISLAGYTALGVVQHWVEGRFR